VAHPLTTILFWMLATIFAIGAVGCAITIPIAAYRFFSVLFEKDESETTSEMQPSRQS
jgi:hypothetical protein